MTTVNDRIAELVKALRMNNNSFGKSLGRNSTTITNVTEGRSKPGFEILEDILNKYPEVNPTWLMKGTGEMFQKPVTVKANGGSDLESELRERIKLQNETIEALQYTVELQKRLLSSGDMGKLEGVLFDRLPVGNPFFLGLPTGIVTGTPVSLRG
ncbi:hypothetical protein [Siphonobacter sp. SORGH_AS_0500]|uniref:hypothetical protein n=1 Tax=Siphonobacter sp. SORGH_AS_0500 TaxID=1864824 RepID=UPI0028554194|nr:hypothetical protein [Siphonobacter sp. SORGH_AS_0500]MDR6195951.1 hypothetical protein [Siphonobacter sp. SORGH_AS_0500]